MTLSLCMIVKDEAATLAACLEPLRGVVDEILVVDTGSTDGTPALAAELGARVLTFEWGQDFAAARNYGLAQVTGDWVVVVDADETLTAAGQDLLAQIRRGEAVAGVPLEQILAITFLRHELGAEQAPYSAVSRLFRRHPALQFQRPYHETIDPSVLALQAQEPHWQVVALETVALTHTGYQLSAIAARQKFQRAEPIMAAYLQAHPEDSYIANKLGALYGEAGQWPQARRILEEALRRDGPDPATRYELHYHLALANGALHRWAEAEAHYRLALGEPVAEILKLGAYLNLGSLLLGQGQHQSAIALFEQVTTLAPDFALGHYNLGLAHRQRGYLDPAIAAYERAIALDPDYPEAHQNLAVALFKLGKLPESIAAFQRAIVLYEQQDPPQALKLRQGMKSLGLGG